MMLLESPPAPPRTPALPLPAPCTHARAPAAAAAAALHSAHSACQLRPSWRGDDGACGGGPAGL